MGVKSWSFSASCWGFPQPFLLGRPGCCAGHGWVSRKASRAPPQPSHCRSGDGWRSASTASPVPQAGQNTSRTVTGGRCRAWWPPGAPRAAGGPSWGRWGGHGLRPAAPPRQARQRALWRAPRGRSARNAAPLLRQPPATAAKRALGLPAVRAVRRAVAFRAVTRPVAGQAVLGYALTGVMPVFLFGRPSRLRTPGARAWGNRPLLHPGPAVWSGVSSRIVVGSAGHRQPSPRFVRSCCRARSW